MLKWPGENTIVYKIESVALKGLDRDNATATSVCMHTIPNEVKEWNN